MLPLPVVLLSIIIFIAIVSLYIRVSTYSYNQDRSPIVAEMREYLQDSIPQQPGVITLVSLYGFIPDDVIRIFEETTNIKVNQYSYDEEDILYAKILSGSFSGDICFIDERTFAKIKNLDICAELDYSSLLSIEDLREDILDHHRIVDEDLRFGMPYTFGVHGICYNKDVVSKVFGEREPDSLSFLFDESYLEKISKYGGILLIDSLQELAAALFRFLKIDVTTDKEEDIAKAFELLGRIKHYVHKFGHNGTQELTSGSVCMAYVPTCDNSQHSRALVKEGSALWRDTIFVFKNSKNSHNALILVKFLFHRKIMAMFSNTLKCANVNKTSELIVDNKITQDPTLWPSADYVRNHCYSINSLTTKLAPLLKHFNKAISGK